MCFQVSHLDCENVSRNIQPLLTPQVTLRYSGDTLNVQIFVNMSPEPVSSPSPFISAPHLSQQRYTGQMMWTLPDRF